MKELDVSPDGETIAFDDNPLENLYDTEKVIYTMINDWIYDGDTMNEIGNHPRELLPFWWEREGYSEQFDWHAFINSIENYQCTCDTDRSGKIHLSLPEIK